MSEKKTLGAKYSHLRNNNISGTIGNLRFRKNGVVYLLSQKEILKKRNLKSVRAVEG